MQPGNEPLQPDRTPTSPIRFTVRFHFLFALPVVQVWPDDAAEEVDSPVEAWRRRTAPQRCSALRAAGDPAVDGGSLRRNTDQ